MPMHSSVVIARMLNLGRGRRPATIRSFSVRSASMSTVTPLALSWAPCSQACP